jgi:hypothetical protein
VESQSSWASSCADELQALIEALEDGEEEEEEEEEEMLKGSRIELTVRLPH